MYESSAGNIGFTFDNVLYTFLKFPTCVGRIREFSIFVGIYPTPPLHMHGDYRIPQVSFKISCIFPKFQNTLSKDHFSLHRCSILKFIASLVKFCLETVSCK